MKESGTGYHHQGIRIYYDKYTSPLHLQSQGDKNTSNVNKIDIKIIYTISPPGMHIGAFGQKTLDEFIKHLIPLNFLLHLCNYTNYDHIFPTHFCKLSLGVHRQNKTTYHSYNFLQKLPIVGMLMVC